MRICVLCLGVAASFLAQACDRRPVFIPASWVRVEPGTFSMGSPESEGCREPGQFKETEHSVTLTRTFEMTVTETTQGQFDDVMGFNPSEFSECGSDCPVDKVSWYDAAEYCNALSRANGLQECFTCTRKNGALSCEVAAAFQGQAYPSCRGYRLPTEAEWEYACRAGTTSAFYNGPIVSCTGFDANASSIAWYSSNSGKTLHNAGLKQANAWGLKDMSGSVWEWVLDWFESDLGSTARKDPIGPTAETMGRVLRGGSAEVPAQLIRSASRYNYAKPDERFKLHGFRCNRTLP